MKDKKRKNAKKLITISLLLFVFAILFKLFQPVQEKIASIDIAEQTFLLERKDTEAERTQGLSGRDTLGQDKGLLFMFEKEGVYGFWMKDMNFPISIIWLDSKCQVTGFKDIATPESFPEVFYPEEPSLYVVEINPIGSVVEVGQKLNCDF